MSFCNERVNTLEHCWHDTGQMLTSNPPMVVDRCCYCGETRSLRLVAAVPNGEHGPYAPFAPSSTSGAIPTTDTPTRDRVEIFWSEEDGEFVAISPEWPGLSGLAPDRHHALTVLEEAISLAAPPSTSEGR